MCNHLELAGIAFLLAGRFSCSSSDDTRSENSTGGGTGPEPGTGGGAGYA